VVGISLRRRDQLKPDVVWAVFWKVIQSKARFELSVRLEVHLDHVRMQDRKCKRVENTKGASLDVLGAIKRVSLQLRRLSIVWFMHILSLWLVLIVTQITNHLGMVMD